jgi:hypothetical protein
MIRRYLTVILATVVFALVWVGLLSAIRPASAQQRNECVYQYVLAMKKDSRMVYLNRETHKRGGTVEAANTLSSTPEYQSVQRQAFKACGASQQLQPGQWQLPNYGRNHGVVGGPGMPKCNPHVSEECRRLYPSLLNKVPR